MARLARGVFVFAVHRFTGPEKDRHRARRQLFDALSDADHNDGRYKARHLCRMDGLHLT